METKQEQINEMLLYVPQTIVAYDANPKGQHLYGEQRRQIAVALYDVGYRKIDEDSVVLSRKEYEMLVNKYKNLEIKYSNLCDKYRLCKDANETLKQNVITARKEATEAIYNTDYHKVDEFEECRKCPAWSGTDCTRNPYTEGCLDDKVNLKNEIKRLKKENACLLKACEEKFTFNTTQNKKYSVFNSVRKEFAEKVKAKSYVNDYCREVVEIEKIDEILKEYE